jgi:DNA-binding CsgD family transcriptional regulator
MTIMSQQENWIVDSRLPVGADDSAPLDALEVIRLSAARARALEEAGNTIARQLNGPLTALLLYVEELKQHSHWLPPAESERDYLQQVLDNALQQTERVCALVKQMSGAQASVRASVQDPVAAPLQVPSASGIWHKPPPRAAGRSGPRGEPRAAGASHKPLTRREREVLKLISEGYSNKQGALHMEISPRTFESHRAEAMRKLGARNTAELVRAALLHPLD